jgi:hypothetical protein
VVQCSLVLLVPATHFCVPWRCGRLADHIVNQWISDFIAGNANHFASFCFVSVVEIQKISSSILALGSFNGKRAGMNRFF